jgi:subfamily B ATP-binding cassette protein MsbA
MDKRVKPYLAGFKPYTRVLGYCRPYVPRLVPAFFCMWIASSLEVIPMMAVKYVVDEVLNKSNFTVMYFIVSGVLAATLVKVAFVYLNTYLMTWVGNKVVLDIRLQLYDKTQKLSLRVLYKRRIGEFISRITNDVSTLQGILAQVAMDLFLKIANVVMVLGAMIYLSWRLTVIAFMIIPVAFLAMARV